MKKQQTQPKDETSFGKWLIEMMILAILLFAGVQLIFHYVLAKDVVSGPSMETSFNDGDRLITYRLGKVKRGSVVVLDAPDEPETLYIKRVIGLPGDTIEAKNDTLYVNGQKTDEPYLSKYQTGQNFTEDFSLKSRLGVAKVPANSYFVMGDNRPVSKDSRRIGFIKKSAIKGIVRLRYWPLNKIQIYTN
ncbi:signal peptidase I [Lapidilactobacillus dextrinicus DSM 20335]|uniref:Signal peptidase I n=1 Tax=Lapidilactobacillus dextrinicus DSM 20335 TaxID=1423738 RepID=A0A0R2BHF2_9LACO|nr:signal peptidase I [Lapidilactobacillus dextrinicus]KRM78942.1 signal peptidase I [Lapidilactobacillus dextrinicus DSM 20335]QFG45979.1 signal peptidase I [Lapidilactobacillus dextrinicus]